MIRKYWQVSCLKHDVFWKMRVVFMLFFFLIQMMAPMNIKDIILKPIYIVYI